MENHALLRSLFDAGVDAVRGDLAVNKALDGVESPDRIVAVGKAAGAMAGAAMERFPGVPVLVVTKDGHAEGLPGDARVIEASHPVPDDRSLTGGEAILEAVGGMPKGSHLLLLVSGGASALAEALMPGVTLEDLAALNARLLAAGLDIAAMNRERRKVSRIKGGRLLEAFSGSRATVLAISDVQGDDLGVIGSGVGQPPRTPELAVDARIIASNAIARAAVADKADALGLPVLENEETLYDDVSALAGQLGKRLRNMPPGLIILGGEPTVVLPPEPGQGGRNQALALELAREIEGEEDLTILVAGTDGTDGPTDAAGAIVNGATWDASATNALKRADSGTWLDARRALLRTGPTGTNVMDLLIALRA